MIDKAQIRFYEIEKCGYYKWGKDDAKYGVPLELLDDIQKWSKKLTLGQTKIYEPESSDTYLAPYLLNINKENSSWLITIWNAVAETDTSITSISNDSTLSEPKIHENEIVENSIPGYPTYFWILPQKNILASIRLDNETRIGLDPFSNYLEAALAEPLSRYTFSKEGEINSKKETEILGYGAIEPENLHPYFKTRLIRNKSKEKFFYQNASLFTRVHRKAAHDISQTGGLAFWASFVSNNFGLKYSKKSSDTVYLYSRLSITDVTGGLQLSEKSMKTMIENWRSEQRSQHNQWANLGFQKTGDPEIHWLSSHIKKTEFQFSNLEWMSGKIVKPNSLLAKLEENKDAIFEKSEEMQLE